MAQKSPEAQPPTKTLVLCIDRDDDVGVKIGAKTPIIGRDAVASSAMQLAVKDPEEADANAMFEAIRIYDHMKTRVKEGEELRVAVVAGSHLGGVDADRKLSDELREVFSQFQASGVILVTDGFGDREIIPVVQSRAPIISIRRIVVRHSESIEESWALFTRYLRLIAEDPRYSKWLLGIPGVFLILVGALWQFGYIREALLGFLLFLGIVFFVRGFGIDRRVRSISQLEPPGLVSLFATVSAMVVWAISLYLAFVYAHSQLGSIILTPKDFFDNFPALVRIFIEQSANLTLLGVAIYLAGREIYCYFTRDSRFWRNIVGIVFLLPLTVILFSTARIIENPQASEYVWGLAFSVLAGIIILVSSIVVVYELRKKFAHFFRGVKTES